MAGGKSIVLIGAGRMGGALASGWLSGRSKPNLSIVAPRPTAQVKDWAEAGRVQLNPDPAPATIVVLAIKPQQFARAAESVKAFIGEKTLVVSVMGGIRLSQLEDRLGTSRVIRAMPNTPGSVGKGVTLLAAAPSLAETDMEAARKLLTPLGVVEGPMDEKIMVAATGISGCGPAYVFLLAEVMAEAGEAEGVPKETAARLAVETIIGAAALMEKSGLTPNELRKMVTSPGGITQAALDILMDDGGMPILMRKALRAAVTRDRELSREPD
ncbi:pyrroline-5-carboxylate reductase [Hyphomonas sp.]|uniref:pyrroline-5-carboxylate reductase n=1 Tax=Hyphomonas sp. TaxID=87 RepID=UPI0025BD5ED5|nr:pyrroline-5-carboxylate reductase [Hyphomonas sp.]